MVAIKPQTKLNKNITPGFKTCCCAGLRDPEIVQATFVWKISIVVTSIVTVLVFVVPLVADVVYVVVSVVIVFATVISHAVVFREVVLPFSPQLRDDDWLGCYLNRTTV